MKNVILLRAKTFTLVATLSAATAGCSSNVLSNAERHIGRNPTGQRTLWCMDFVNLVLKESGKKPTNSRQAASILKHGRPVAKKDAQAGDIVYYYRNGGSGHVEVFSGWIDNYRFATVAGNTCGPTGSKVVCRVERHVSEIVAIRRPE